MNKKKIDIEKHKKLYLFLTIASVIFIAAALIVGIVNIRKTSVPIRNDNTLKETKGISSAYVNGYLGLSPERIALLDEVDSVVGKVQFKWGAKPNKNGEIENNVIDSSGLILLL